MVASFTLALENDRLLNAQQLYQFCVDHRQVPLRIVVNNEGHCLDYTGVYQILDTATCMPVQILTGNALETHHTYWINNEQWHHWLDNFDDFDFDYDLSWDESKILGCFYGRPSAARLGLAGQLLHRYREISDVYTQFDFADADSRKSFDLERLFAWHPDSVYNLHLLSKWPRSQYDYHKGFYAQSNSLSQAYKSIMIDIIVEPVCQGRSFYPTEKFVRAVLCRRMFIVMASRNYLDYLHQIGFHTFNEFWDESYDGLDGRDRYLHILDLIDNIANLSHMQQKEIFYSSEYQRDHNFNLLTTQSYGRQLRCLDD